MTAYFDAKHEAINKLKAEVSPDPADYKKLCDIETSLVWDVTIASETPGFPEELRDRINKLVLKYGSESQPVNSHAPEYDEFPDHCEGMNKFVWDLHTVFHELAQKNLDGFSDDPRTPLRIIYARGEERREELAETHKELLTKPGLWDRNIP